MLHLMIFALMKVLAGNPVMSEIFEAFRKFSKDEQETVRILAVKNCIMLGKLNTSAVWQSEVMDVVKDCCEDKSWRVRYMVADQAKELCEVFEIPSKASIVPLFLKLLGDAEIEVRTIASARIAAIAQLHPTKEFLESLMPSMEKLTLPRETSANVRGSLAGSVLSLTSIFGTKLTADYLMGLCSTLIRDECSDVQLKLIYTLGEFSSFLGSETVLQSLLPDIKELAKDRQWRVRVAVLGSLPHLASSLGEARFTQELASIFMTWLVDPVYAVRHSAASIYKRICEVFGDTWSASKVVPELNSMLGHKNYLVRVSAIPCVGMLAETVSKQFLETDLVPMLVKMSKDPVPNVRVNVGKTIQKNAQELPGEPSAVSQRTISTLP
jgi:serine/threonine-protein phosphatase 2A regulatory subunit A